MTSRVVLISLLFAGSVQITNAAPLDSPEIVYIDGTPCNRMCQSYMAWSRQVLSGSQAQMPPKAVEHRAAGISAARPKSAARERVAKQAAPAANRTRRDKIERLQQPPAGNAIPTSVTQPAEAAVRAAPSSVRKPAEDVAGQQQPALTPTPDSASKPTEEVAGLQQPPVNATPSPVSKPTDTPDLLAKTGPAAGPKNSTIQDQVMAAAAVAEQLTLAPTAAPELKAMKGERFDDAAATEPRDDNNVARSSPNATDARIVLLVSRPQITSVTDLAGKNVAIDNGHSGSASNVRIALVAAGATEVQLSTGETKAIARLVSGEVPAAVLTLVSPDAAEAFPEIVGFKVFRVPLSPGSLTKQ